ncbi:hypothetical protein C5E22_14420 [Pectobacterium parmentieri]|uniref:Uncharacterized protein n=1 Tax=Pectobacterium parmentieri TaxID=1905730 RepID=A0A8B3FR99_PECPM|nr:hypothetical protein [Pectobacterium parmentieri]AOR59289.1 hypothetical protein A8F97_10245 [Pectobacterium parmentieri]AYH09697.1 hypothetical protein C5E24_08380 [Pectobacterium parmentieri]AYH19594.1 hypothetical protein C5E22_14420 [Pectobacterium parmentieri]AZS56078.1 hypothetical protein C5E18_08085 [Pectobacterium parmentieri]RKO75703.1 hypothetical protein C5E00_02345 [Pectobacterium parmentieri]
METLENAQLALSRVQFIAEIALVADCDKKDLQTALATISHLVEVELKTRGLVSPTTVYGTKN